MNIGVTEHNEYNSFRSILKINSNRYIATSNAENGIYYSTDGYNWYKTSTTKCCFNCIAYGNNTVIISRSEKEYYIKNSLNRIYDMIYYSTDKGSTWTESDNVYGGYFNKIIFIDNIFVASYINWYEGTYSEYSEDYGYGIYYSEDGIEWTRSNNLNFTIAVYDIAYNEDTKLFVLATSDGMYYFNKAGIIGEDDTDSSSSSDPVSTSNEPVAQVVD
jgi:hypothetical protein